MAKPRSKKDMIAFLTGHYRYNTMNSWNRSTSYACNIKVSHLGLTRAEKDACYAMLDVEGSFDESGFNDVIDAFGDAHDHRWQIGTNGRSGGYLVLYQGERKPSEHKSRCNACGQKNFKPANEVSRCGRCGEEGTMVPYAGFNVSCFAGRSTDEGEDFSEWSTADLRARVDLVTDFDKACAAAVKAFVAYAVAHKVVEKTVMIPKQINVAVPA